MNTIIKNDLRNKYKYIILTKNNKKSYDFNSEIQKRYKQNILSKINNLKNVNSNFNGVNLLNSYSIDLNFINYKNKTYSNYFNDKKGKSKEKDKKSDGEDLFKKIMSYKIGIKNKKEEKRSTINSISNNTNNNLPLTIRVNTSNFLSKIKEKYKLNDYKNK